MRPLTSILAVVLSLAHLTSGADDRETLLQGVNTLPTRGSPGGISVIGPNAFSVIAGKDGESFSPVVAAASWEQGRVVAFGHNGYLGLFTNPDVGQLLLNAVHWTSAYNPEAKVGVRTNNGLAEFLAAEGFAVTRLEGIDWLSRIAGLDVICIDAHNLRASKDVAALSAFVRGGGGLITAGTGWGWASANPDKSLAADFAGNQLLIPAGLAFNTHIPERTASGGFSLAPAAGELLNASNAIDALIAHEDETEDLDPPALTQAIATATLAFQSVPPSDTTFLPRIMELARKPGAFATPTAREPIDSDQPISRLLISYGVEKLRLARPEQIRPHPAALEFPGGVPGNAPIENRELSIDTSVPGWHSTGLYAAPGASIKISIPADHVGYGYRARIGCHTDRLWEQESWSRIPEITVSAALGAPETRITNAFGGPIYLEIPDRTPGFTMNVTIQGGVGAPHFVLGKTTPIQWLSQRLKAAPWAELECGRVILTIPSRYIRHLEDPTQLARFWDDVVRAEDDLAGTTFLRTRPERIVADLQISGGYMHGGYPVMCLLDASASATDLGRMKAGVWGFFHELGHNHQSSDWTFNGSDEVTCNLFSLYVMEKVCGKPPGRGHSAMEPGQVARRIAQHLRSDSDEKWERWKSDPFLALAMYDQLRAGFGWGAYQKVFAEYRDLPKSERPRTEQQKRDQWMVRFSRTVRRNLGPFFEAWGIPVTDQALQEIESLPGWMPDNWPKT